MAKKVLPTLKALSIAQPWAECIMTKGKNVENRSWNTRFRGYFAIHASASNSSERFEDCKDDCGINLSPENLPFGAIVGFAKLVDVVTDETIDRNTKKWFGGDYGFVLSNIIHLKKSVPAKGSLSFWSIKGKTLKNILNQLTPSQRKKILNNPLARVED